MTEIRTITTGKVEILAVKVPEGVHHYMIYKGMVGMISIINEKAHYSSIKLPTGNWQIVGIQTELTEEQWIDIVPEFLIGYEDYMSHINDSLIGYYSTAKESGLSLMQANQCYSVNPYGEKPKPFSYVKWQVQKRAEQEWQQAQSNTGTWLILLKQERKS